MSGPPFEPDPVERALGYLRENRDRFTRPSLDQNLRFQGYSDSEISTAWERLAAEQAKKMKAAEQAAATKATAAEPGRPPAWAAPGQPGAWVEPEPAAVGPDLRGRATAILLGAFIVVGGVLSAALLLSSRYGQGSGGALIGILVGALVVVLIPSFIAVRSSRRLRQGVEGALVAILAVPFVLLFIVAGICVATTNPFGP